MVETKGRVSIQSISIAQHKTNTTPARTDQYDHRQQTHICFQSHWWMLCAAVSMYGSDTFVQITRHLDCSMESDQRIALGQFS